MEVCVGIDEQAEGGACVSRADPVAGQADGCVAAGPCQVLGCDRSGRQDRGRCGCSERVIPGRVQVVPSRWWCEPMSAFHCVGSLPLVRRTRGDCHPTRQWARCPQDRPPDRQGPFDGLTRASTERSTASSGKSGTTTVTDRYRRTWRKTLTDLSFCCAAPRPSFRAQARRAPTRTLLSVL